MSTWEAIILAIIEGITEYLPISSTGHMILASSVLGIASNDFVKMFTVAIQFGAILSVVVIYYQKFLKDFKFYIRLCIAFIPAAILGFLLNDIIDSLLESALTVGITLFLGGIFLLFVDKIFKQNETKNDAEPSMLSSLWIGFFQVIAMIPGVSRSAATIVGGMAQGLNRKSAAEFSFFLAVPTMLAATAYKMYKYNKEFGLNSDNAGILMIGNLVAFVVAWLAIKGFIKFLTKHGFKVFGWYRIIIGGAIIILYLSGKDLQIL